MSIGDLPIMLASNYASSTYTPDMMTTGGGLDLLDQLKADRSAMAIRKHNLTSEPNIRVPYKENQQMASRRIVQVIIADSNENVPLEDSILYKGEQKLTEATDQELFFEIDIRNLLAKHNEKRVTFFDKKVKERTEHLEPAKVRDLKMVVVTGATL